ncbi:MAG TPA: FliH/SctL family protein [Verrucomicrobiae bacterium]|nr:FliH/SctL family protein [Verrucomicrobiae bacterium]
MKPWRESLSLGHPLRDARLAGSAPASQDYETRVRERERAAREAGRVEGERALSEQLVRQRADLMELQTGVLESLRQAIPQVVGDTESAVIALALEVATKLVAGMPISAKEVEGAVHEAMRQIEEETEFTVDLHPKDLELLRQANSPLTLPGGRPDSIQFRASDQVSRGGCILHTRFGAVDTRRETKIAAIKEALLS